MHGKPPYINATTLYFKGFARGLKGLKYLKLIKKQNRKKPVDNSIFCYAILLIFYFFEMTKEIRTTFVFCSIKKQKRSTSFRSFSGLIFIA